MPSPRRDSLAPTFADIALPPRRRLRDGSSGSLSMTAGRKRQTRSTSDEDATGSGSASASASVETGSPATNASIGDDASRNTDTAVAGPSGPQEPDAEQSRRLPRLSARARAPLVEDSDTDDLTELSDEEDDMDVDEDLDTSGEYVPPSSSRNAGVSTTAAVPPVPSPTRMLRSHSSRSLQSSSASPTRPNGILPLSPTRPNGHLPPTSPHVSSPSRPTPPPIAAAPAPASPRSPASRASRASHASPHVVPSASTSAESSPPRRFTAQEKGKGRARPSPSPTPDVVEVSDDESPAFDQSVQWVKTEVPEEEAPERVVDEDDAITAFTCPVCFSAPTAPALTPCGHILCYTCLHASLLASIGRQINPFPLPAPRGRPRGRGRGRGRGRVATRPQQWTDDGLRDAWTEERDTRLRTQMAENGVEDADAEAMLAASAEEVAVEHPLNGLWKVGGEWVIEGECPVCRKPIPGGLGPIGSKLGGVILLDARVATE